MHPWTRRFSRLGEHGAIWIAIGLVGWRSAGDAAERERWARALRAIGSAYAINTAIKLVVRRRRPAGQLAPTPTALSFPSAHAATSFCAARSLGRAGAPAPPLWALALALSWSRLRLGVHHRSDVAAGALLGFAIGGRT